MAVQKQSDQNTGAPGAEMESIFVLGGRVRLQLPPGQGFRPSLDSVMLAAACRAAAGQRVLDVGCSVGTAGLCVQARAPGCVLEGVDVDDAAIACARVNGAGSTFSVLDIFSADAAVLDQRFDHVICNPPFLDGGTYTQSPDAARDRALGHGDTGRTLEDWMSRLMRFPVHGGELVIIHRADHADRIIARLSGGYGAVEIIPLWPRAGEDARRVIIRARRGRKTPCVIKQGLILHEENGDYTAAADAVLRDGTAL